MAVDIRHDVRCEPGEVVREVPVPQKRHPPHHAPLLYRRDELPNGGVVLRVSVTFPLHYALSAEYLLQPTLLRDEALHR